jgi:hypothetical protein
MLSMGLFNWVEILFFPYYTYCIQRLFCNSSSKTVHIELTAVMKVETDIITSIAASPIGWNVILVLVYVETFITNVIVFVSNIIILVLVYVETFITNVIVFVGNIIMCLMSHWQIIFSITVSWLILTISLGEIKGKMSKISINNWLIHCSWYIFLVFMWNLRFANFCWICKLSWFCQYHLKIYANEPI